MEASVTFETGNLTYTWYTPTGGVMPQQMFDLPNTRRFPYLTTALAGSYYVTVVDDMGTPDPADDQLITSASALIEVQDHVAITSQPAGGSVQLGNSFTFTVGVNGGGYAPLTYQWWKEGSAAPLAATGTSLTLDSVTVNDSGKYYVTISDGLSDVVESAHVTLNVSTAQLPVASLPGLGVLAGICVAAALRAIRRKK